MIAGKPLPIAPIAPIADRRQYLGKIFGDDLHAMRVLSVANSVVGVLDAAALSIHAIGRGYAHATGMTDKHAERLAFIHPRTHERIEIECPSPF